MRKVTVRGDVDHVAVIQDGRSWEIAQKTSGHIFGDIPPVGESRDYIIAEAGQVVEFKMIHRGGNDVEFVSEHPDGTIIDEYFSEAIGEVLFPNGRSGETRRVTCIVHAAETTEPKAPPKPLRQCWFRVNGNDYHGVQVPGGSIKIQEYFEFPGNDKWGRVEICPESDFQDEGIEITWYGDEA